MIVHVGSTGGNSIGIPYTKSRVLGQRNSFHSDFELHLADLAKQCLGYVWMTFDNRNASEMRLGHILLITNIIEVLWTRILFDKSAFSRICPNDAEHPTDGH